MELTYRITVINGDSQTTTSGFGSVIEAYEYLAEMDCAFEDGVDAVAISKEYEPVH